MPIISVASALCYFPDGNSTNDAACGGFGSKSTCCGPGYACLSNNLCAVSEYVAADIAASSPSYVRAGCTDESWSSKNCPKYCLNSTNGDNLGLLGMGVGKCDGGSQGTRFYCRNEVTAGLSDTVLCSDKRYYFEFDGKRHILHTVGIDSDIGCVKEVPTTVTIIGVTATKPSVHSTSSSTSSAASFSTSTTSKESATSTPVSTSSSPTASSTPADEDQGSDKQRTIGIGVGLGLGIPLLCALVAVAIMYSRKRPRPSGSVELDGSQEVVGTGMHDYNPPTYKYAAEYPVELNTTQDIHEAPDSSKSYGISKGSIGY